MNKEMEELREWANSKDCECELSHETFMKCCGKRIDPLQVLDLLIRKDGTGKRFKDLDKEAQLRILNLVAGEE